ncbi:MAG TPA: hypothetical protein VN922_00045 [Bacteroidia bacterium]|nr:hypothetical protein [Bacteroidia bacterium]
MTAIEGKVNNLTTVFETTGIDAPIPKSRLQKVEEGLRLIKSHFDRVGDYQPSYFYQQPGPGSYQNGWYAGQQDAIYDHDNNLQYNPAGQCLPCHSELYWNGFHEGYDKQWNSYQSTNQGTSINIYGNGNYVNTDQNSAQSSGSFPIGQGPGLCGSFDCGGPGRGGPDP